MPGEQFDAERCEQLYQRREECDWKQKKNAFTRCLFPVLFNDSVLTELVTHKAELEQAHYWAGRLCITASVYFCDVMIQDYTTYQEQ